MAGLALAVSAAAMAAIADSQVAAAPATLTLQQPETPEAVAEAVAPLLPAALDPVRDAERDPLRGRPSPSGSGCAAVGQPRPSPAYAAFLDRASRLAGRGGDAPHRREGRSRPDAELPAPQVVAFFDRGDADSPTTGRLRYAEALAQLGRAADAQAQARRRGVGQAASLSAEDEARLLSPASARRAHARPSNDHSDGACCCGTRMAASAQRPDRRCVSPERRPLYAARLAMQTRAPDAAQQRDRSGAGFGS